MYSFGISVNAPHLFKIIFLFIVFYKKKTLALAMLVARSNYKNDIKIKRNIYVILWELYYPNRLTNETLKIIKFIDRIYCKRFALVLEEKKHVLMTARVVIKNNFIDFWIFFLLDNFKLRIYIFKICPTQFIVQAKWTGEKNVYF